MISKQQRQLLDTLATQEYTRLLLASNPKVLINGWTMLNIVRFPNVISRGELLALLDSLPTDTKGLTLLAHSHAYDTFEERMRVPGWTGACRCDCVVPAEIILLAKLECFETGYTLYSTKGVS